MQTEPRRIELLAPARDLETARAAIQHGADAVYVGAPRFGARAAAGVPLEDLRTLCREAHLYGVSVYVTLNTIIYDHELEEVELLIWDIYRAGADALIIQDMGITLMNLPPIALHSSTQCDTTEPEDAVQLEALGFDQIVLARELNVEQIRRIRAVTTKPLEVFIHGALCVSYSGRCYISEAFTGRSANRGECSQQCRMSYNLKDSQGRLIRHGEYLLSPKDLNRTALLEELLDAGVSSFKIEGRLKSISYVKNITAHYRLRLDDLIARFPQRYKRSSLGRIRLNFQPNPVKSFNRGFTDYQFHLPNPEQPKQRVVNIHSPKSQGEYVGTLTEGRLQRWKLATEVQLANGDGLFYITPDGKSGGIHVNKSLGAGLFTSARPIHLPVGSRIFRNYDQEWERRLAGKTAERRLAVSLCLSYEKEELKLTMTSLDSRDISATVSRFVRLEPAKHFDELRLRAELSKLGDTIFEAEEVAFQFEAEPPFVPVSIAGQLRRELSALYTTTWQKTRQQTLCLATERMPALDRSTLPQRPHFIPDYRANVANKLARRHYDIQGYKQMAPAYELSPTDEAYLMTTKHCIKHELGYCTREGRAQMPFVEPLYLEQGTNRIRLEFDCHRCQMYLIKA